MTAQDLAVTQQLADVAASTSIHAWLMTGRQACYLLAEARPMPTQFGDLRFDAMLAKGLLEEVAKLRSRGDLHPALPAMRLIGYRQLWEHLEGATTLAEAAQKAVVATRQLARRQLTWLRAEPGAEWFDPFDPTTPERIAARIAEWFRERGIPARRC